MVKSRILVVDDEEVILELFHRMLEGKDYNIETASNGRESLQRTKMVFFNLLIIDLTMPGINGIDVLKEVKKSSPDTKVIIITGYHSVELAVEAIKLGAFDFICKPFNLEHMITTIEKCLEGVHVEGVKGDSDLFIDKMLPTA